MGGLGGGEGEGGGGRHSVNEHPYHQDNGTEKGRESSRVWGVRGGGHTTQCKVMCSTMVHLKPM